MVNKGRMRPMFLRPRAAAIALALLVLVVGLARYTGFLSVEDETPDGFRSQFLAVATLIDDGSLLDAASENALVWVHLGRVAVVAPFVAVDGVFGAWASLLLMLLILLPLTSFRRQPRHWVFALVPLLLPLMLSGRGVLVAASVGYLVSAALHPRSRGLPLWLGVMMANLSSASVLTGILVLLLVRSEPARGRIDVHRSAAIGLLGLSLVASLIDKSSGFISGDVGYEAYAFDASNPFLVALSRSTLIVSLGEGQYLRAAAYSAIAIFLSTKLVLLFGNPHASLERRVMLCCLPGILMEGLGVVAMVIPLVWLLLGTPFGNLFAVPTRPVSGRGARRSVALRGRRPAAQAP